ncbi:ATP-binding protein [Cohnella cellulosilytica]|uniref:hybrid sensor histidine kinase/response regulator n=1 Tax=Cohnella cellulosilytica TaxID=986710 RepID=UPI003671FD3B
MSQRNIAITVILFALALTGARMAWISHFHQTDQPRVEDGLLDLRGWKWDQRTIALDGEWEFYPGQWLGGGEIPQANGVRIPVPGGWNAYLRGDGEQGGEPSFGYGSYRLVIRVDPGTEANFAVRVPSVRSSSALYANGRLLAGSGFPSDDEASYEARNLPYGASFAADRSGYVELIVRAANYKDIRDGGIIRSIKFGTEAAIARETQLSVSMQELTIFVFLLHGGYALVLYVIGNRERRLLYFSLLVFSAMVMDSFGSNEKVLHQYLPVDYDWGFKLVHLAMAGTAYSLLMCVSHQWPAFWRKAAPWFSRLCGAAAAMALVLPARYILTIQILYAAVAALSVLLTIFSMIRASVKDVKGNVPLLFALVAFTSNLAWWGIQMIMGISVMYYPFDLVISTSCYASLWFTRYFQAHAETKSLAAKLQRADKQKDRFLANTSHELRNPLHGILNITQGVLEREKHALQDRSVKDLEVVLSVGRRMSLLLNDLLYAMSLKENAPRLQYGSFSIHAVATGVIDMLLSMREGVSAKLVNDIPENFPRVYADENRVVQILFNLLHNAVKFTGDGEVAVRARVEEGKVFVTVSDTGIGMDEETLNRIFEPYEQESVDQTMIEGGFGLGLGICKQLLEMHGESLQASSVPGQGSEFVFTLRLAAGSIDAQEQAGIVGDAEVALAEAVSSLECADGDEAAGMQEGRPSADRPRILLIDDDPVNLKVLESILTHESYDMTLVTSGSQALDILDKKEWDLIVSDVMLPRMSGYELTRAIRARYSISELPILLLTARSQPEDISHGFQAGANEYVTKPVEALELRFRVKALTDVKKSVRERLRMESAWLHAQIQPHFLYNTLTAIRALSEIDLDRMRSMLEAFGNHLRDKFKLQNIDVPVPIEEELSLVRSYLHIEQERYEQRLLVTWEIDECKQLRIPLLTIQPLVENAIRHGVMKRSDGGRIAIRVSDFGTFAEIAVEDDGVGMDENPLERKGEDSDMGTGVGLINTDRRLKRMYGKGLRIRSQPGRGTSISFIVDQHVPSSGRAGSRRAGAGRHAPQ